MCFWARLNPPMRTLRLCPQELLPFNKYEHAKSLSKSCYLSISFLSPSLLRASLTFSAIVVKLCFGLRSMTPIHQASKHLCVCFKRRKVSPDTDQLPLGLLHHGQPSTAPTSHHIRSYRSVTSSCQRNKNTSVTNLSSTPSLSAERGPRSGRLVGTVIAPFGTIRQQSAGSDSFRERTSQRSPYTLQRQGPTNMSKSGSPVRASDLDRFQNDVAPRKFSLEIRTPESTRAVIAFGSNTGDRLAHIENAISALRAAGIEILGLSKLYETKAM